jgi:uncharacterized membrane protein (UPF0127 family)
MKLFPVLLFFLLSTAQAETFKTGKIKIKDQILKIELAESAGQHSQGLMFRKKLEDGNGMLFIFSDSQVRSFWMKNTFIPLSIAYFSEKKVLIDLQDMAASKSEMQNEYPSYVSAGPAKYALEVPIGWFKKHKIKSGDSFEFLK